MDLNKLKGIADKLKKDKSSSSFGGEYPKVSFLPVGTHKGRFIVDPDDEVYHKMFTYGYFSRGIEDPAQLPAYDPTKPDNKYNLPMGFDVDNHPLAQVAEILVDDYKQFGKGRKFTFLTYFYLTWTDAPNENWQPGNLYCVIGNGRVADAFTDMLSSLVADSPEHLLKSLDPSKEGPIMQVTFAMGTGGKCNISPTFNTHPPIVERTSDDTDETYKEKVSGLGWRPLKFSYIYPGYNQEKYDNLVKFYTEELEKQSKGGPPPEDKPAEDKKEEPKSSEDNKPQEDAKPPETQQESPTPKGEEKPAEVKEESADPFAKYRKK